MYNNICLTGNKGGVAISLSYLDTTFCFLNSHLAAHQTKCGARNDNMKEIVEGCVIGYVCPYARISASVQMRL